MTVSTEYGKSLLSNPCHMGLQGLIDHTVAFQADRAKFIPAMCEISHDRGGISRLVVWSNDTQHRGKWRKTQIEFFGESRQVFLALLDGIATRMSQRPQFHLPVSVRLHIAVDRILGFQSYEKVKLLQPMRQVGEDVGRCNQLLACVSREKFRQWALARVASDRELSDKLRRVRVVMRQAMASFFNENHKNFSAYLEAMVKARLGAVSEGRVAIIQNYLTLILSHPQGVEFYQYAREQLATVIAEVSHAVRNLVPKELLKPCRRLVKAQIQRVEVDIDLIVQSRLAVWQRRSERTRHPSDKAVLEFLLLKGSLLQPTLVTYWVRKVMKPYVKRYEQTRYWRFFDKVVSAATQVGELSPTITSFERQLQDVSRLNEEQRKKMGEDLSAVRENLLQNERLVGRNFSELIKKDPYKQFLPKLKPVDLAMGADILVMMRYIKAAKQLFHITSDAQLAPDQITVQYFMRQLKEKIENGLARFSLATK